MALQPRQLGHKDPVVATALFRWVAGARGGAAVGQGLPLGGGAVLASDLGPAKALRAGLDPAERVAFSLADAGAGLLGHHGRHQHRRVRLKRKRSGIVLHRAGDRTVWLSTVRCG